MNLNPAFLQATLVRDPDSIRDIAPDVLGPDGRLRVLPAAFWETTTAEERALFGHRYGLYSFPTVELVEYLRDLLAGRRAIEIGAGHGVLAEALGIPATDNRMQEREPYKSSYALLGQAIVPYGPNIIDLPADRAVSRYKPDVVIGCWVTHRYDPRRHQAGGNEIGIDEGKLLDRCTEYVVIGNDSVRAHQTKPIWERPHSIVYPSFVYSRALDGSRDFIATWRGSKPPR